MCKLLVILVVIKLMPESMYIINTFSNSLEVLTLEINLRNKKYLLLWISYTVPYVFIALRMIIYQIDSIIQEMF